ncbi:uncharacterized protein G6M90_00g099550 [Metarhizium brunneum]|uniref:Uncharacterized protein n=1 Tax=Metarhizium brunneum TaxID=500148 RepID=A0A7D5ZAV1_9HYPO
MLGREENTICYNLRYFAGNNSLDKNCSEALRNLVLDHAPYPDTFQKHHLNREICVDLYAIHQNQQPRQQLIDKATSIGHSQSLGRPLNLPPDEYLTIANDPIIRRLELKLKKLPRRSEEFAACRKQINATRRRMVSARRQVFRKAWTVQQSGQCEILTNQ